MGKFQLFVLLSVVTCAIITTVQSVPVKDSSIEKENADKCKKLCGFCGCTGYFCGDECLCECNSQTEGDAACVDTMKDNCKKLELPFEVLIQGPNINRMVRSLLYADPEEEVCVESSNQKKRSTVSIYKPDAVHQRNEILSVPTVNQVDISSDVHQADSPIHIIVAHKLDYEVDPVKVEPVHQDALPEVKANNIMDSLAAETVSNDESENYKLALLKDDIDRINTKRHIIDINQDISEFVRDSADSFLYKRDTDKEEVKVEEVKVEEVNVDEVKPDEVGAAAPAPAAPPAPAPPAPLLPKVREAIEHIKAQIPTSAEIKTAWEGVQKELNTKISDAITEAKRKAVELRDKITPPPPPPPPTPAAATIPVPAKIHHFFEDAQVGNALIPIVPNIPVITAPLKAEIVKGIATLRANNKLIQEKAQAETKELISNFGKTRWLITPPLLLGSVHEEEKHEEEKKEEEKKEEEKKEEEKIEGAK